MSEVSISKWIKSLILAGYIYSEISQEEGNKRYLFLKEVYNESLRPIKEKFKTPLKEKFKHNNKEFNTTSNTTNKEVIIPDFIDIEIWKEWEQYRKEKKQKLTATTVARQIKQLEQWHNQGHNVNGIISNSIAQGWTGLFEPKKEKQKKETQREMIERVTSAMGYGSSKTETIDADVIDADDWWVHG